MRASFFVSKTEPSFPPELRDRDFETAVATARSRMVASNQPVVVYAPIAILEPVVGSKDANISFFREPFLK